jgi:hypothetical protein
MKPETGVGMAQVTPNAEDTKLPGEVMLVVLGLLEGEGAEEGAPEPPSFKSKRQE